MLLGSEKISTKLNNKITKITSFKLSTGDLSQSDFISNDFSITKVKIKRKCKATEILKIQFAFQVINQVKYLKDSFLKSAFEYTTHYKYFFRSKRGPPILIG